MACPLLARPRLKGFRGKLLLIRVKRTPRRCASTAEFDPDVWSGRASQEILARRWFVVLHQCIRPLIGARHAPDHHGYQRACDLISGQTSTGPFGSPVFACAGKTEPPSRLILSQTSAGKSGDCSRMITLLEACSSRRFGHEQERSRRCVQAYWQARSPGRCDAVASWRPRSKA